MLSTISKKFIRDAHQCSSRMFCKIFISQWKSLCANISAFWSTPEWGQSYRGTRRAWLHPRGSGEICPPSRRTIDSAWTGQEERGHTHGVFVFASVHEFICSYAWGVLVAAGARRWAPKSYGPRFWLRLRTRQVEPEQRCVSVQSL